MTSLFAFDCCSWRLKNSIHAVNAHLIKLLVIFCVCFVVSCSRGGGFRGFPAEAEVNANLHRDMSPEQVAALFGEPLGGRPARCADCPFLYHVSMGLLTAER